MATLYADCSKDGYVAIPDLFGGDARLDISGMATDCPICGKSSPVVDGEYTFRDSSTGITSLRPRGLDKKQLSRLQVALTQAAIRLEQGATEAKVEHRLRSEMDNTSPGLSGLIDKALRSRGAALAGWLSFAAAVVGLLLQLSSQSNGVTPAQIEQIVQQVYEQERADRSTPDRAPPTPTEPPQPIEEQGSDHTP